MTYAEEELLIFFGQVKFNCTYIFYLCIQLREPHFFNKTGIFILNMEVLSHLLREKYVVSQFALFYVYIQFSWLCFRTLKRSRASPESSLI